MNEEERHCYAILRPKADELARRMLALVPYIRTRRRYLRVMSACVNLWIRHWATLVDSDKYAAENSWAAYVRLQRQGRLPFLFDTMPHANDNEKSR